MRTRLYVIWDNMKQRCCNPHKSQYKNYGARGITVCDEWRKSFHSFRDWAMKNGYTDNLTIDRLDPNSNYCPENCRWITNKEQQRNKRNNVYLTCNGVTQLMQDWANQTGLSPSRINLRIKAGWSVERALTEPIHVSMIRQHK